MPRKALEPNTRVRFPDGGNFLIGEVIGEGGGALVYSAREYAGEDALSGVPCVIKECYPKDGFTRNSDGRIVPEKKTSSQIIPEEGNAESKAKYASVLSQFKNETAVSQDLYADSFRALPVRQHTESAFLTLPGGQEKLVPNCYALMDDLSGKGRSLHSIMKDYIRLEPRPALHLTLQLLRALEDVHRKYLHLDLSDGNVFYMGSLSEEDRNDDPVFLIDFGAARPLELPEGKTAEISGTIPRTDGFAAPELYTPKEGLRLTPAADIFSVGCLLAYFLRGTKLKRSKFNTPGTGFLDNSDLRRIHIPNDALADLQAILFRALDLDPEKRYQSAADMRKDVQALLDEMKGSETLSDVPVGALAETHFDAFVSFEPGLSNSVLPAALKDQLETYRFRAQGKRIRPITRVCLDPGELPSGPNYKNHIELILENSEFLVLLCSPGTPRSTWVGNILASFISSPEHGFDRVIAVLIDGTPETSIPSILLRNAGKLHVVDARGRDDREILRNLRKKQIFGVLAPMLNTNFDALYQRHRLKKAMYLGGAMVVAFTLTLIYARLLIRDYRRDLLEQVNSVAAEAQSAYDSGNITEAVRLALEALPGEGKRRTPANATAQHVLEESLNVYHAYSQEPRATICYRQKNSILRPPLADEEAGLLFTYDEDGFLNVWDCATDTISFCSMMNGSIVCLRQELMDKENHRLYFVVFDPVYHANQLWGIQYLSEPSGRLSSFEDPLLETEQFYTASLLPDGRLVVVSAEGLQLVDPETGETTLLKELPTSVSGIPAFSDISAVTPDGKKFLFFPAESVASLWDNQAPAAQKEEYVTDRLLRRMAVYDLECGTLSLTSKPLGDVSEICFTSDGSAAVLHRSFMVLGNSSRFYSDYREAVNDWEAMQYFMRYWNRLAEIFAAADPEAIVESDNDSSWDYPSPTILQYYGENDGALSLFSPDGTVLWEESFLFSAADSGIRTIPSANSAEEAIFLWYGNSFRMLGARDGQTLCQRSVSGNIVFPELVTPSKIIVFTDDGYRQEFRFLPEKVRYRDNEGIVTEFEPWYPSYFRSVSVIADNVRYITECGGSYFVCFRDNQGEIVRYSDYRSEFSRESYDSYRDFWNNEAVTSEIPEARCEEEKDDTIRIFSPKGRFLGTVQGLSTEYRYLLNVFLLDRNSRAMAIYDDGTIVDYDLDTGRQLHLLELPLREYCSASESAYVYIQYLSCLSLDNNTVLLRLCFWDSENPSDNEIEPALVLDTSKELFGIRSVIRSSMAVQVGRGRIIASQNNNIIAFPRYSLDQLVKMGHEFLGSQTVSPYS